MTVGYCQLFISSRHTIETREHDSRVLSAFYFLLFIFSRHTIETREQHSRITIAALYRHDSRVLSAFYFLQKQDRHTIETREQHSRITIAALYKHDRSSEKHERNMTRAIKTHHRITMKVNPWDITFSTQSLWI